MYGQYDCTVTNEIKEERLEVEESGRLKPAQVWGRTLSSKRLTEVTICTPLYLISMAPLDHLSKFKRIVPLKLIDGIGRTITFDC